MWNKADVPRKSQLLQAIWLWCVTLVTLLHKYTTNWHCLGAVSICKTPAELYKGVLKPDDHSLANLCTIYVVTWTSGSPLLMTKETKRVCCPLQIEQNKWSWPPPDSCCLSKYLTCSTYLHVEIKRNTARGDQGECISASKCFPNPQIHPAPDSSFGQPSSNNERRGKEWLCLGACQSFVSEF